MKLFKKAFTILLVFASIVILLPTGVSAEWKQSNSGWWYTEGNSWATGWRQFNGTWYYFDSAGYMKTGWVAINGSYYFFYTNGAMASNATINGFTLDSDGRWIPRSEVELRTKLAEQEAINKFTSQPVVIVEDNTKNNKDSDKDNNLDGIN